MNMLVWALDMDDMEVEAEEYVRGLNSIDLKK